MSIINSFLQKNKMHESHHGIYLVVMAYILSAALLFIGSDVFYGIVSKAENISTNSVEATPIVSEAELINPYGLGNNLKTVQTQITELAPAVSDDTNWLLGYAMDPAEFDELLAKMDEIGAYQAVELGADEIAEEEDTIESFGTSAGTDKVKYSLSGKEVSMLEKIVEAEASGEDMIGKILIVNVIFNRMEDDEFPDTVEDVIFQKVDGDYQFSPISDERYWDIKVSEKTEEAVQRALEGEDYSEGALYFIARSRTKKSSARWFDNHLDWLFKHGGHDFYKNK
jgi:N-acetylmuramoyl-L-alanine amidase